MEFSARDLEQLNRDGRNPESVQRQFSHFETGFPPMELVRPATKADGIVALQDDEIFSLLEMYDSFLENNVIAKFVPASGAASRMFKELYSFLELTAPTPRTDFFMQHIKNFPFAEDLAEVMRKDGISLDEAVQRNDFQQIVSYLLTEKGLNYGNLPKGVLRFHKYEERVRTAVEEHLVEGALYARNHNGDCHLHFTVSPSHLERFQQLLSEVKSSYEKKYDVHYHFTFSVQDSLTDTLAADENNQPFHDDQGNLLFRPGGHGALIGNLNKLHFDAVIVKNIDNVCREKDIQPTVIYKKVLTSYLLDLKTKRDFYLRKLETNGVTPELKSEILAFAKNKLLIDEVNEENLFEKMNRPMRVCGMVKNEGEPGGGPFWVKNLAGVTSLQIVESSQIDMKNPEQKKIVDHATHFNPVDMVCSFKDYQGDYFNLARFVDENTGFISSKSYGERTLKAMELPGLWNGAMANWITIFVEVPLATFNPVKTVFDLLKHNESHL
ncbi:MAG: DUF4301 family protein [Bacteroidales bacterium]|nr:DUF4301 family protein [Bacteroidales bacterium]